MVYVGCYEAYVKSGCYIKNSLRKDKTQCLFYESAFLYIYGTTWMSVCYPITSKLLEQYWWKLGDCGWILVFHMYFITNHFCLCCSQILQADQADFDLISLIRLIWNLHTSFAVKSQWSTFWWQQTPLDDGDIKCTPPL